MISNETPRALKWWEISPVWLLVSLLVLLFVVPYVGTLEGKLFPVASKAEVLKITPFAGGGSGGWVIADLKVEKFRTCKFNSISIYWVDGDGTNVRIPWKNLPEAEKTNQSRPVGKNIISILVGSTLPPEKWNMNVFHECRPFMPEVKTKIM